MQRSCRKSFRMEPYKLPKEAETAISSPADPHALRSPAEMSSLERRVTLWIVGVVLVLIILLFPTPTVGTLLIIAFFACLASPVLLPIGFISYWWKARRFSLKQLFALL